MPAIAPTTTTVPSQTLASGAHDSIAAADTSTAGSSASQGNGQQVVQLDVDELEMLLKRGKEFLADGDLASARLLLRRAAEGGSAEAALVLGTTFDPLVIERLGVLGAHPDIGEARHWYQRAAKLGSNTASQRLARLAAAP
jgi:TPR repeat protein